MLSSQTNLWMNHDLLRLITSSLLLSQCSGCYVLFAMFNSGSTFVEHQLWVNGLRPWMCECNTYRLDWGEHLTGGDRVWKHLPPRLWHNAIKQCEKKHDNVTLIFVARDPRDWYASSLKRHHTFNCKNGRTRNCIQSRVTRSGHSRIFARYTSLSSAWNAHVGEAIARADVVLRYEDFVHDVKRETKRVMQILSGHTWSVTRIQNKRAGRDSGITLDRAIHNLRYRSSDRCVEHWSSFSRNITRKLGYVTCDDTGENLYIFPGVLDMHSFF